MTTTPEIVVFPNVVPVVIAYLTEHLPDASVAAALPPDTDIHPQLPWIIVIPQGGGFLIRKQLDEVIIRIDVFHHVGELEAIDDLGRQVRALIESMQGQRFSTCAVTRTRELSGYTRLPDPDPHVTRAGLTVSLLVRPL